MELGKFWIIGIFQGKIVYVNDVASFPTFKGSKSFRTKLGIIEIYLGGVENRKNMYL